MEFMVESGSNAIDANSDGIIDGSPAILANGLFDSVETFVDSEILKYTITDTDGDGIANYRDLDSDNDLCSDVFLNLQIRTEINFLEELFLQLLMLMGCLHERHWLYNTKSKLHYCSSIVFTPLPNFTATCNGKCKYFNN
jgi:hypothetical protein